MNRRDILHTSLSTHTPRSLITPLSPHSRHELPTLTATLHSLTTYSHHTTHSPLFTTQHTLHSLPTLSPDTLHSLTTHSLLSHHTNLSAHTPVCHYKLLHSLSYHTTLSILSTHHTPPTFTSKQSLTTHSHYHLTPHTPHSLSTPHTLNTLHTTHSKLSHHTTHSPFSHFTLTSLPSFVPVSFRISLPTLSPHSPLFYFTSYSRTSL